MGSSHRGCSQKIILHDPECVLKVKKYSSSSSRHVKYTVPVHFKFQILEGTNSNSIPELARDSHQREKKVRFRFAISKYIDKKRREEQNEGYFEALLVFGKNYLIPTNKKIKSCFMLQWTLSLNTYQT